MSLNGFTAGKSGCRRLFGEGVFDVSEQASENQHKVVGTKQTLKAIEQGKAVRVFVASDADEKVIKPVLFKCRENNVELEYVDTMIKLGKLFGIKVKAATAAFIE